MLHAETKRKIDSLRDTLVGKIPVPHQQVEQITLALIYKFMSDIDEDNRELGGQSFFNDHYKKYRWDQVMDRKLQGHERVLLYSEGLEQMALNEHLPQLFRDIFKGAYLPFKDPVVFDHFLKGINDFSYDHSEELGNAFEYLLSIMGSQGDAGQFRTPRHIINFIVEAVDPTKEDTVLDPACGTAGFLIAAYKHILQNNTDPKSGQPGSALTSTERQRLGKHFTGYDISHEMVRLSLANLYLHGFPEPRIYEYDTLSSEERWGDDFSCILANPPFMTPRGGIQPHRRFSVQSKRAEVLFVDYIMEHLTPQGKAGVIVPEGIIFQSGTAYKQLRKMLVDEGYLYAVVSLPSGVFQPYSGVKTSILLFDKTIAQKARDILFVKVEHDGFSLGTQRRASDQNDLPTTLDLIAKYKDAIREGRSFADEAADKNNSILQEEEKQVSAKLVSKEEIAKSGDYNLSGDRYAQHFVAYVDPVKLRLTVNPVTVKTQSNQWPMVEIGEVCDLTTGGTPKSTKREYYENGDIKWLVSGDIHQGEIFDCAGRITRLGLENSNAKILPVDSVLIALNGQGKTRGTVALLRTEATCNQSLVSINPKDKNKLLSEYLYHVLKSKYEELRSLTGDNQRSGLNMPILRRVRIPILPISKQKEIVAEIDRYQKIIDGARQVIKNWEPKIEVDPEWPRVQMGNVCDFQGGSQPPKSEFIYEPKKDYIRFIQIRDFGENGVETYIPDSRKNKRCETDDVLIARYGASLGRICSGLGGAYNVALLKTIPDTTKLSKRYLFYLLKTPQIQQRIQQLGARAAQAGIRPADLKLEMIPLPNLSEQQEVVDAITEEETIVVSNRKLIKQMERKIDQVLEKI